MTAYLLAQRIKDSPSIPTIAKLAESASTIFFTEKFYVSVTYTMKIVWSGVGISFVVGTTLAIFCSAHECINEIIMPIVNCIKNIPSIALFPVFIVLMGIGDLPRIFVIIWNSFYPIVSSTLSGINSIDKEIIEAAENCGAGKLYLYLHIKIPLAFIRILEGLKISIANGFIAIVVAEMLGATKGLGYMIVWSSNAFKYADMYIYILVVSFLGFAMNVTIENFIKRVERRLFE